MSELTLKDIKALMSSNDLTVKDIKNMSAKPNTIIDGLGVARARIEGLPEEIVDWYENNQDLIKAEVVIVRSSADEGRAAAARNADQNTLFIFAEGYYVPDYFSGTSRLITFTKALLKRGGKIYY